MALLQSRQLLLLLLLPLSHGAESPSRMPALLATGPAQRGLAEAAVPELGMLHEKFRGLPDSCEVLLRVKASSVNPADRETPGPFPQVMGSDIAAVVEAVQPNCTRLQVGDLVWADIGAVVQTPGGKGKENGAYAPFAVALESQLGPMPNVSVWEAAALPKVSLTSYKALKWYGGAPYAPNMTVLVLGGSGGCGSTGIQLAKAWGAGTLIATTSAENELYVRGLGADRVLDYRSQNWWEVLPKGAVDVIYDTVGEAGTGDRAVALLREGGYYVTITGALPQQPRPNVKASMFINSATNLDNLQLLEELRDLVDRGLLRMPEMRRYELADILEAFNASATHHVRGKLVIDMTRSSQSALTV
ncbi:AOR [Symbiodinium natans]|uniref:AOR protein n=1 Tax=Symbiodinium natans TaxID=878477 RepID=A0A812RMS7_9DINO|nr:AOR [Symbiodinium natans]